MKKDLLLLLAQKLETIPEKKFGIEQWMNSYDYFERNTRAYQGVIDAAKTKIYVPPFEYIRKAHIAGYDSNWWVVVPTHCQTAGCAMGWAATMEEFKKHGLNLIAQRDAGTQAHIAILDSDDIIQAKDFGAAKSLFELSLVEVGYLFASDAYLFPDFEAYKNRFEFETQFAGATGDPTPKQVADRIRKMIGVEEVALKKNDIPLWRL